MQLLLYRSLSNYLSLSCYKCNCCCTDLSPVVPNLSLLHYSNCCCTSLSPATCRCHVTGATVAVPVSLQLPVVVTLQVELLLYRSLSNYLSLSHYRWNCCCTGLSPTTCCCHVTSATVAVPVSLQIPVFVMLQVQLLLYRSLSNYLLLSRNKCNCCCAGLSPNTCLCHVTGATVAVPVSLQLPVIVTFQVQLLLYRSLSNYLSFSCYRCNCCCTGLSPTTCYCHVPGATVAVPVSLQLPVIVTFQVQLLLYRSLSNYLSLSRSRCNCCCTGLSPTTCRFHVTDATVAVPVSLQLPVIVTFQVQLLLYRSVSNYLLLSRSRCNCCCTGLSPTTCYCHVPGATVAVPVSLQLPVAGLAVLWGAPAGVELPRSESPGVCQTVDARVVSTASRHSPGRQQAPAGGG